MTITLDTFEPRRLISANRRIHHMVRAEVCAYWRRIGHDAVIDAYGYADVGETWHTSVRMVMTFRFPDLRRRDCHNLYGYVVKPLVDGMVDARLLPDDNDRHLVGPDVRRDLERGPHRIEIGIEDRPLPKSAAVERVLALLEYEERHHPWVDRLDLQAALAGGPEWGEVVDKFERPQSTSGGTS